MESLNVGELKATFSDVLAAVQRGKKFAVAYGRKHKPVAMIVPYVTPGKARQLGVLSGRGRYCWQNDGRMTDEELLQS